MLIEAMAIAMTARVRREQILMLSFIRYLQVGKWETTVSIHQNAALEIFLNVSTRSAATLAAWEDQKEACVFRGIVTGVSRKRARPDAELPT